MLNMNPSLSGCAWYMRIFLEEAEARFWFTMAVPLYVFMICGLVYAVGRCYDCYYDSRHEQRNARGAEAAGSAFSSPARMQDDTRNDPPAEAYSGRITAHGGNYLQRTDSKMYPLIALDRAYKVMFSLANVAYLPLCYQSIAGSWLASREFDFILGDIPKEKALSGSYLLNSPEVIVPESMFSGDFPADRARG
eukprot:COSAG02_NODE_4693_length_5088_cov_3.016837_3_plen_193_part_00